MQQLISQGAEAKIFLEDNSIIKNRFPKRYRIAELDTTLRTQRTRKEAKILEKLESIRFPSPKIVSTDKKEIVMMEHIQGKLLKDMLNKKNCYAFGAEMGEKLAILHNNGIIHGDLTTSNIIVHDKKKELYFIDFGLSFISPKDEDRAVDLHVLKEALESKHYQFWEECFESILSSYKNKAKNSMAILKRYDVVEKRGRYRAKKGS